jgi:hypothetical protein
MSFIPLQIPPGVYRNGTELQSAGRWYDANLVRFFEGTMRPMGGWRLRSTSAVTGAARGLITWKDNGADAWVGIGTHSGLYAMRVDGAIANITPAGFTSGSADATISSGYGTSQYGIQAYGVARQNLTNVLPATTWTLDTWGEYLVGCSISDGKLYEWQLDFGTPTVAAPITNAPVNCKAVVVTAERIMFALGAGGNPRKVAWSDQENNTVWTSTALNQAGDFELATPGTLMTGKRVRGITLLWTDVDCHAATYVGQPYIYGFEKIGSGCGLISPQSVAIVSDATAIWMSKTGFWMYDGAVKPLQSDVGDYVYRNLNIDQASKVYAVHNGQYGEVWWFYPSANSTEVDSYVLFNYREGHWNIGSMARTSGTGRGAFDKPLLVGTDGYVYEHEVGFNYGSETLYCESGPMQLGNGDALMAVKQLIPDELNQGDVTATFKTKFYPNAAESSHGPYSMSNPTSVRFTARQIKMRIDSNGNNNWRVGTMRIDAVPNGRR